MKRILLVISILILKVSVLSAQNPNYVKAMEGLVSEIQNTRFGTTLLPQANKMERIAAAEKAEWLPNYWVSYCYMMESYVEKDDDKRDLLLDKADVFVANIEKMKVTNDETEVLKANIANARMAVSPSIRWMKYGSVVEKALENAKKINPKNPRITLLEAQGVFYTPEMFGGGKAKAKPVFEKAMQQLSTFKPVSAMYPTWGESTAKWTLSQIAP